MNDIVNRIRRDSAIGSTFKDALPREPDMTIGLPGNGRVPYETTENYANRLKSMPERGHEAATLGHVFKAQEELLQRLRGVEDHIADLHTRMVGSYPEVDPSPDRRETNNMIESLVAGTLDHLEVLARIERRVSDLVKVLQ